MLTVGFMKRDLPKRYSFYLTFDFLNLQWQDGHIWPIYKVKRADLPKRISAGGNGERGDLYEFDTGLCKCSGKCHVL